MVNFVATQNEFDDAIKNNKKVVVDFTASWCPPCQRIGPKFVALAADYPDILFIKVDVDVNSDAAASCKIQAMPTFQFYFDGAKVAEFRGADEKALKEKIDELKEMK